MTMTTHSLSVRLPEAMRERLEVAAQQTKRSRSFLVQEALTRHLSDIVAEQSRSGAKSRLERLRAIKGTGARLYGPRTEEDIEAQVREFRGDE